MSLPLILLQSLRELRAAEAENGSDLSSSSEDEMDSAAEDEELQAVSE